jgi:hypothetical protein
MEKGGPPYAADGSLDYAESGFPGIPSRFILRVVLIAHVAQWKTRSVYFPPSSPTRLVLPLLSLLSSLHHHRNKTLRSK